MNRATRLLNIPPYPFARWATHVRNAAAKGRDIIRLDIGSPDMPPSERVIEALCRAARQPNQHGYAGHKGLPRLRVAMADYYQRRFAVSLDPETEVVPLIGSKEGIVNMAMAILDPGDMALVPDPGYAPYRMGAILAGAETYTFPLLGERGFLPDLDAIPESVTSRAKLLWLNYPNNPTGATADPAFLEQAVAFARQRGLLLCHDAPYCDITYGGYEAPSVLQIAGARDVAVEFNSFSKTFNMAGWRMGMAIGNSEALSALAQIKSNIDSGVFVALQEAAIVALQADSDWLSARNQVYEERMAIMFRGLESAGLPARQPRATLYAWAQVPAGWPDSEAFAHTLLMQTGVAIAPGSIFGPAGEGYVRLSITAPTDRLQEAMERLIRFVDKET